MAQESSKPTGKAESTRQAIIQADSVGFYPVSGLGVSALSQHKAQAMIAMTKDHTPKALSAQTLEVVVPTELRNQGLCFDSLADAFYRGRLPEILLVTSPLAQVPSMLEDWLSYIEKLAMLGYFEPSKGEDEIELLDQCVPTVVLTTEGILYNAFMSQLEAMLKAMDVLSPRQKERMIQKFVRGFWQACPKGQGLKHHKGQFHLHLAGKKSWYSMRACNVLQSKVLGNCFNPSESLGVLEGELKQAHHYIVGTMAPVLIEQKKLTAKAWKAKAFSEALEALAQAAGILPGVITIEDTMPPEPLDARSVSLADLALLHQLGYLAKTYQQPAVQQWVATLTEAVQTTVSAKS